jgi:hypothetical protein
VSKNFSVLVAEGRMASVDSFSTPVVVSMYVMAGVCVIVDVVLAIGDASMTGDAVA